MPMFPGGMGKAHYPNRNRDSHAIFIKNLLRKSYADELTQKQVAAIRYRSGMYLEFASALQYDLEIKSLDNRTQGISLLNVHEDEESGITRATVYIPEGKENFFLKQVEEYQNELTKKGIQNTKSLYRIQPYDQQLDINQEIIGED